jgi:hypothetical protein
MFGYLKQALEKHHVSTFDELWQATQLEWASIPDDFIWKLVQSMPKRVSDVIKAKDGPTKY